MEKEYESGFHLIEYRLYKDIIDSRTAKEKQLTVSKQNLAKVTAELKETEDFISKFEDTQSKLTDSIAKLEKAVEDNKRKLEEKEDVNVALNNDIADKSAQTTDEKTKLNAMEDKYAGQPSGEKDPELAERIKEQKAVILVLEDQLKSLESSLNVNKSEIDSLKDSIKADVETVGDENEQVENNKTRKKEIEEEGIIDRLTADKESSEADKDDVESALTEFLDKNQTTIDAYETQENARSKNILRKSQQDMYNRQPEDALTKALTADITKGVVTGILDEGTDNDEKELRSDALEAGAKKDFNPDFMDADEAVEYTLKNIWSTKQVAEQIKEACENGKYEVRFPSLSDNIIYALQHWGYKVSLENMDANFAKDQDILVSWGKLPDPKQGA